MKHQTTILAAELRKELKTVLGYNSRMVSVRADIFSMGSSIDIRIKDKSCNVSNIEKIAKKYENHRYDKDGIILSGCWRFVNIYQ